MGEGARPPLLLEEASAAGEQPLCYMLYSPRTLPPRTIFGHLFCRKDDTPQVQVAKKNEGSDGQLHWCTEGNGRYGEVLSGRKKQSEDGAMSVRSRAASDSHETPVLLRNVGDQ